MLGKQKCHKLKEIRQRIAEENDIPYVTKDCGFQGACSGTCPKCESELRYLEQQLALRQSLGKRVAVTALCATMAFAASGCGPKGNECEITELSGDVSYEYQETENTDESELTQAGREDPEAPDEFELMGEVAFDWSEAENGAAGHD